MRQFAPTLALALLIPIAGCGQQSFRPFMPPEGGYTVLMPGSPSRSERDENGLRMTVYEAGRPNESYAVASAAVPPGGVDLDGAVSGLAGTVGASGTRSQGQSNNGDGWREFEIEANGGRWFYSGRVLATRERFYTVLAAGADARLSNPRVKTFIESFRLTDGATPGPGNWSPAPAQPMTPPMNPSPPFGAPVPPFGGPTLGRPSDLPPPPPPPAAPLPNPAVTPFRPTPPAEKIAGHPADPTFRDEAPAGGWLVGFDVWYSKFVNNDIIGAIRPIYWVNNAYALGQVHGTPTQSGTRLLAKPGYVVGAVNVRAALAIDAITVTFMKANGEWLDKNDSYISERLGGTGGWPTDISSNGAPVTGIVGRKSANVSGLGLTYRAAK
ncbi:hypothetical protein R5W23_005210 [Gemmata sp. JC673]|uniref:Uncharacterized protein n=1 Tax=Gemmata algarum TaxID=2975278 RepID=A0ABU5F8D3_9BACT|nr:hypothetical protein [Gemmata algarum]MDY3563596.1 hypothetical protein [Gemmata algarum]